MYGQTQLIPGVVRKVPVNKPVTTCIPKSTPLVNQHDHSSINKPILGKGIIPGSIRPIGSKTSLTKHHVPPKNISAPGVRQPAPSIDQLTNQAIEEILRETELGKLRAEQHGATAWRPCPLRKTNKHFLNRTLISAVNHNNRVKKKTTHRSRLKLSELVRKGLDEEESNSSSSSPKVRTSGTIPNDSTPIVINLIEDSD